MICPKLRSIQALSVLGWNYCLTATTAIYRCPPSSIANSLHSPAIEKPIGQSGPTLKFPSRACVRYGLRLALRYFHTRESYGLRRKGGKTTERILPPPWDSES